MYNPNTYKAYDGVLPLKLRGLREVSTIKIEMTCTRLECGCVVEADHTRIRGIRRCFPHAGFINTKDLKFTAPMPIETSVTDWFEMHPEYEDEANLALSNETGAPKLPVWRYLGPREGIGIKYLTANMFYFVID